VTSKGHLLFRNDILGLTLSHSKIFISNVICDTPIYEDCTWGKPETCDLLSLESYSLMLWFKSGILDEIVLSCLFEKDGNTVIWSS